ncbi:hypothetical protein PIB30_047947 [Stylosanthes scabra]|uniref:Uncharacterized protein n=1 Tax=Stylosanthes scabra TaxID=79078 RepID=A0ABU6XHS7_9FABA|nr:hypothetical protein [Stylosanthes scabra]
MVRDRNLTRSGLEWKRNSKIFVLTAPFGGSSKAVNAKVHSKTFKRVGRRGRDGRIRAQIGVGGDEEEHAATIKHNEVVDLNASAGGNRSSSIPSRVRSASEKHETPAESNAEAGVARSFGGESLVQ